jgi:hypothetical protein
MIRTDDGRIEIRRERRITRDGPPEGGLELEVEELRNKVDGMHKQMEEMRRMLQQLLEQTRQTPPTLYEIPEERDADAPAQEMKEY